MISKADIKRLLKKNVNWIYGKTFSEIENKEHSRLQRYNVISFDVFDTLINRAVEKPSDVFELVGRKAGMSDYKNKRICAEKMARRSNLERGIHEVTLDEIYDYFIKLYSDRLEEIPVDVATLKELEIATEYEISRPNAGAQVLFNKIKCKRDAGDDSISKVIIVSDMYLSSDVIEKLLYNNGVYGFDRLYVSSMYRCTKKNGDLYSLILKDLGVSADSILHIGDNFISDYLWAKKNGINAILCK